MRFSLTKSCLTGLILFMSMAQSRAEQGFCVCTKDLAAIVELLSRDYAGYAFTKSTDGPQLEKAYQKARDAASGQSGATCDEAIRTYLAAYRDGHLLLMSKHSPPVNMPPPLFPGDRAPLLKKLSKGEILLRVPSFGVGFAPKLNAILREHEAELRSCKRLIIDVRGNTGGSDSTWTELFKPIYSGPIARSGIRWLATPGNADAIDAQVKQLRRAGASQSSCSTFQQIADDMRAEKPGSFVQLGPQLGTVVTLPEVWESPQEVAILTDGSCGSSCENFLITAEQSEKVTVFGEPTYGAIDFQNVRSVGLPSKERQISFAMSISDRVLTQRTRMVGIQPDHPLSAELLRDAEGAVQRVLVAMRSGG